MKIRLCKKFPKVKKLVKKIALSTPNAEIKIKSCIGMCKICKTEVSALVSGEKIHKKTIKKFIKEIEKG
ncbi:MAG: hypothetical protein Q9M40_11905 [Sulfurimonas sp.]|nr:hypothetical protein [Sulfurimonas sp.]MDQ7068612.1 hypothetical protein [Sulfurimonas sp.]